MDQVDVSVIKLGLTLKLRISQLDKSYLYYLLTASDF